MSIPRLRNNVICSQNMNRILYSHFESMSDTVPQVFAPFNLRNKTLYQNLSRQLLTVAEITFIGSEAAGITSSLTWETEKFTVIGTICKRYTLPIPTVREWMEKVIASVPISSKIERPSAMDGEAIEKFRTLFLLEETPGMQSHYLKPLHSWTAFNRPQLSGVSFTLIGVHE
jgi:hypothetical protein